jgi:hypothetical protein
MLILKKTPKILLILIIITTVPFIMWLVISANYSQRLEAYKKYEDSGIVSNTTLSYSIESDSEYKIWFYISRDNDNSYSHSQVRLYSGVQPVNITSYITELRQNINSDDGYSSSAIYIYTPRDAVAELTVVINNTNVDKWTLKIYEDIPLYYSDAIFALPVIYLMLWALFILSYFEREKVDNKEELKVKSKINRYKQFNVEENTEKKVDELPYRKNKV